MKLLFCVNKSVAFIPLPLYFIRYTHQPIIKKKSQSECHASGSSIQQIKGKIQREEIYQLLKIHYFIFTETL